MTSVARSLSALLGAGRSRKARRWTRQNPAVWSNVDRSMRFSAAVISARRLEVRRGRERDVAEHHAPAEVAPHRIVGAALRASATTATSAINPTNNRRMSFTRSP